MLDIPVKPTTTKRVDISKAVSGAIRRVPPLWPLEHFVAVNPFLGFSDQHFVKACGILRRTVGHAPVQAPREYRRAWEKGGITEEDLAPFTDEVWTQKRLVAALSVQSDLVPIATYADLLDQSLRHAHWAKFISEEVSKWCAVHFDRNQTTWISPWKSLGLFAAWKAAAVHDCKPETFGLPGFRAFVRSLPETAEGTLEICLAQLSPEGVCLEDFLHRQLVGNLGWAGHVQYLVREDKLRGIENESMVELLAIRVAYDAALRSGLGNQPGLDAAWEAQAVYENEEFDTALARWQSAFEAGYQKSLSAELVRQPGRNSAARPLVQAVFCIDVRSEIVRRHLEAALPGTHTLGFAGFFGFPVAHQPGDCRKSAPRCPVLLVPPIRSTEENPPDLDRTLAEKGAWKAFQNSATSCFTFVETLGLAFGAKLIGSQGSVARKVSPVPMMPDLSVDERAALAEGMLRGMSLTRNFARIIYLCGHGSHSANNPYASSLDCGACGGHSGDVNARLAAATLNDMEVRAKLSGKGIDLPTDTVFVAGKHDTLTDDFLIYDKGQIPETHMEELGRLQSALVQASSATREERAPKLGLGGKHGTKLEAAVRGRGVDNAQTRPEWALANNAAFIAAPRARTAGLKLDGRTFLHEYDPDTDPDSAILTAILTAPVVVASWINLQYYGSRIHPALLAAGNKTIHQVLSGLGVIEGNAGDLRSGLPLQSIHDGRKFVHEPRRLTVFIESTPDCIDAVLEAQAGVRELFDNEWIHLIVLQGSSAQQRRGGRWHAVI